MARHHLSLAATHRRHTSGRGLLPAAPQRPLAAHHGQQPPAVSTLEQEMAVLAFVAYVGERLTGGDDEVERTLAPCTVRELELQPLVATRWSSPGGQQCSSSTPTRATSSTTT